MPKRREDIHEDQQRKALSDLKRLNQQSDGPGRWDEDLPVDDESDEIERWGKKIGRTLGFLFLIYLLYYFSQMLL